MNLYFRFFVWLLKSIFASKKKQSVWEKCTTYFWVNPLDLDINLHMNNGRYLSIMDLGRLDLMVKAGVFYKVALKGYYPVVVSQSIRFKKSLQLFQKFYVETSIESWDEKDFYMAQKFFCKSSRGIELLAEGYVKARFRKRGSSGSIGTPEMFEAMGISAKNPQVSELALQQKRIESLLCGPHQKS